MPRSLSGHETLTGRGVGFTTRLQRIRLILKLCWPEKNFDQHIRKTWIVDSVLCSAKVESGPVSSVVERECRHRYLDKQLAAMPNALIVALGGNAQKRLKGHPGIVGAYSPAGLGGNLPGARPSWEEVARRLRSHSV